MSDEEATLAGIPQPEIPKPDSKPEPLPESQEATYVVPPEGEKPEGDKLIEAAAAQTVAIPTPIPTPSATDAATVEIIHKKEPPKQATPPEEAMTVEISHKKPPTVSAEAMTVAISHAEKPLEPIAPRPEAVREPEADASFSAATVEIIHQKEPVIVTPVNPVVEEPPSPPAKKSRKTLWIILIVAFLLLCCCVLIIAGVLIYRGGLQINEIFNEIQNSL
jgi:hypothetical protein